MLGTKLQSLPLSWQTVQIHSSMNHLGKIALYLLLAAHALPPLPTLKLEKDEKEKEGVKKNEKCSSPWQVSKTIDSTVQYSIVRYNFSLLVLTSLLPCCVLYCHQMLSPSDWHSLSPLLTYTETAGGNLLRSRQAENAPDLHSIVTVSASIAAVSSCLTVVNR